MHNDCKGFRQHKKKGTKALIDYLNRKNTTKLFDILLLLFHYAALSIGREIHNQIDNS